MHSNVVLRERDNGRHQSVDAIAMCVESFATSEQGRRFRKNGREQVVATAILVHRFLRADLR